MWSAAFNFCPCDFPAMMDCIFKLHRKQPLPEAACQPLWFCHKTSHSHNSLTIISIHHSGFCCWFGAIGILEVTWSKDPPTMSNFVYTQSKMQTLWLYKSSQCTPGQVLSIIIMFVATFIILTNSNISPAWPNEEAHCNHEGRKPEWFHSFTQCPLMEAGTVDSKLSVSLSLYLEQVAML